MSIRTMNVQELQTRVQGGEHVDLIDVRTPLEFQEVHIPFARNVPLSEFDPVKLVADTNGNSQALYVICRSGNRAQQACEKLRAAGYADVVNIEGGTQAWDQAGLPVVRGEKTVSLERQVRIAAGGLVLLGAVLGFFVHPYWIGLSALIGAGLIFAGVTDTCGMGLMLAKMPWNQVAQPDRSATGSTCCTREGTSCTR